MSEFPVNFLFMCRALELTESEHDVHADIIRHVLNEPGFDVNKLTQGRAALHVACCDRIRSHVGAQLLLSDERCNVNLQNYSESTALMMAVRLVEFEDDKHARIIRLLLAHPRIEVNKSETMGITALHVACDDGIQSHVGAQLLLSDERCDVNLSEYRDGVFPLMTAVRYVKSEDDKHAKIVRLLLAHPRINVNHKGGRNNETALHVACKNGIKSHAGAQLLLSHDRCDVNEHDDSGLTALMKVANMAQSKSDAYGQIMQILLQRPDIDINKLNPRYNSHALFYLLSELAHEFSSSSEELDVLKLLLNHGADPNVPAHLLARAVNFCSLDVCRELLQHGADPNSAFSNT